MAIVIDGSANTIGGLAVGGLPDGSVDTDTLAANAVTAAKSSGLATTNGITEADQWRINAAWSGGDPGEILTSGWERCDTGINTGKLGTGMSQSSGVFTFPSTGWWHIIFAGGFVASSDTNVWAQLQTNGNTPLVEAGGIINNFSGSNQQIRLNFDAILDITDTSADAQKLKLRIASSHDVNLDYYTEEQRFGFTFIRLGDT